MSISFESLYRALDNNEILEAKKILEHPSLSIEDVDAFYFFEFVVRNGRHEILSMLLNHPRFGFIMEDCTEDYVISFLLTAYSNSHNEIVDKMIFDDRFEKHIHFLTERKNNVAFYTYCMKIISKKERLKKVKSILA